MLKTGIVAPLLAVLLITAVVGCIPAKQRVIKEAKAVYNTGQVAEKAKTTKKIVFVRITKAAPASSDYDYDVSDWTYYRKDKMKDESVSSQADIYFSDGKLSSVHITDGSFTGDWMRTVEYYYRNNGTLAYMLSEYRGFCGDPISKAMEFYFTGKGVVADTLPMYRNLKTKNAANEDETAFISGIMSSNPPAIYRSVAVLLDSMKISDSPVVKTALAKKAKKGGPNIAQRVLSRIIDLPHMMFARGIKGIYVAKVADLNYYTTTYLDFRSKKSVYLHVEPRKVKYDIRGEVVQDPSNYGIHPGFYQQNGESLLICFLDDRKKCYSDTMSGAIMGDTIVIDGDYYIKK